MKSLTSISTLFTVFWVSGKCQEYCHLCVKGNDNDCYPDGLRDEYGSSPELMLSINTTNCMVNVTIEIPEIKKTTSFLIGLNSGINDHDWTFESRFLAPHITDLYKSAKNDSYFWIITIELFDWVSRKFLVVTKENVNVTYPLSLPLKPSFIRLPKNWKLSTCLSYMEIFNKTPPNLTLTKNERPVSSWDYVIKDAEDGIEIEFKDDQTEEISSIEIYCKIGYFSIRIYWTDQIEPLLSLMIPGSIWIIFFVAACALIFLTFVVSKSKTVERLFQKFGKTKGARKNSEVDLSTSKVIENNDIEGEIETNDGNEEHFCISLSESNADSGRESNKVVHIKLPIWTKKYYHDYQNFIFHGTIGMGEFGDVRYATLLDVGTQWEVAVKSTRRRKRRDSTDDCAMAQNALEREGNLMSEIGFHVNIVNLQKVTANYTYGAVNFYLVLEYCENGSLERYLKTTRFNDMSHYHENESEDVIVDDGEHLAQLLSWGLQIASGMSFLSSRNIVHGDLAARNVLLAKELIAKISDFGFSAKTETGSAPIWVNQLPAEWMAPEAFENKTVTPASDVWSYGVTLYEIFNNGRTPREISRDLDRSVDSPENSLLVEKTTKLLCQYSEIESIFGKNMPHYVVSMIKECWNRDPSRRPMFKNLVEKLKKHVPEKTLVRHEATMVELSKSYVKMDTRFHGNTAPQHHTLRRTWLDDQSGVGEFSFTILDEEYYLAGSSTTETVISEY